MISMMLWPVTRSSHPNNRGGGGLPFLATRRRKPEGARMRLPYWMTRLLQRLGVPVFNTRDQQVTEVIYGRRTRIT